MPEITIKHDANERVIGLGTDTAEASRQAGLARIAADTALAAGNFIDGGQAAAEAATTEGDFFSYSDGAGGIVYAVRTAGGSTEIAQAATKAQVDAKVDVTDLASTTGAAQVGKTGGGSAQDHINYVLDPLDRTGGGSAKSLVGGVHILPATTPGGDDAPNVVVGSLGAVDLPADTYGNFIQGPRDNDVSGGAGYRNRLGSATSLAIILGGDNDINALAAFNIGHHNRADATGGGDPSHPMMIGTYLDVTSAYGVAVGTEHAVHSTKAAAVGGAANRIGTEGSPDTARESFIAAGFNNTVDGQYAGVWAGNTCKASKDYSHASGLKAIASSRGERVHSSISFSTPGDCQHGDLHLARTITGDVMTQLLLDGTATPISALGSSTLLNIDALINVVRTDVVGNTACYRLVASISNLGGTLSVKSQTLTVLHEDDATWNADVSVTATAWQIRVAAGAGQTVRASAHVRYNQLRNV